MREVEPGLRTHESMIHPKNEIVFLTRAGCSGTKAMLANFEEALHRNGLSRAFRVQSLDDVDENDVRTAYGTPTVLIDGRDLMGMTLPTVPGSPT